MRISPNNRSTRSQGGRRLGGENEPFGFGTRLAKSFQKTAPGAPVQDMVMVN
jgi:hypothetical protein